MPRAEVLIVGGGPAGLSTAGALARLGHRAVVFEREEVGGRWASRYDSLHLHTARRLSGLAHLGIPAEEGRYVSKDGFARYLRRYAATLELDVRAGVEATAVRPVDDAWEVETADGLWDAQAVVLATGRHDLAYTPSWPGVEDYRGRLVHSSEFRTARAFRKRSVLVVGIGNSGAEIAGELARAGSRVAIAVRSVPPIALREMFGVPVQVLGIVLAGFPARGVDRVGSVLRRARIGDLSRYGLAREDWGPFTARRPPVIDVGFLEQLKAGRIDVRPAVTGFTASGVTFADGTSCAFEAVIAATGFRSRLPGLLDVPGLLDDAGCPAGVSPQGLYFVGFRDSVRGAIFEIAHDSRNVARTISAQLANTGLAPRHDAGSA